MRPLLLLAPLLLAALPAHALSCVWGPNQALPVHGATDVPTNLVARVDALSMAEGQLWVELVDADGEVVAATIEEMIQGNQTIAVLTPDAELEPNASYVLRAGVEDDPHANLEHGFMTGAGPDTTPPDAVDVHKVSREKNRSEWGPTDQVAIEIDGSTEQLAYEVQIIPNGDASALPPVWVVAFPGTDHLSVGEGLCLTSMTLPGQLGGSIVKVVAVDLAGNRSDEAGATLKGGCSSLPAPAAFGGLLVALGLVGFRRRRA